MSKLLGIVDKIPDLAINLGVAYAGYCAAQHWMGALSGLILYRMATSNNLAAGAAGVTGLAIIGLTNVARPWWISITPVVQGYVPLTLRR